MTGLGGGWTDNGIGSNGSETAVPYIIASGTNTYTAPFPAYSPYVAGDSFEVKFTNANTGASTLNINGNGAIALVKNGAIALVAGDIQSGAVYLVTYDGTNFQLDNVSNFSSPQYLRQAMANINTVFSAGKTEVALTVALTAPRTLTLPAANSFQAGTVICFVDEIGGITSTNTVAITRAGSDTINGLTTVFTLYTTNVMFCLVTDGSSKWTGGVISSPSDGTFQAYTITFGGFSADPTSVTSRYMQIGKLCFVYINATAGTSSGAASIFTITLPIAAANTAIQTLAAGRGTDNGSATTEAMIRTRVNSVTADVYPSGALGTWAVGSKNYVGSFCYETI